MNNLTSQNVFKLHFCSGNRSETWKKSSLKKKRLISAVNDKWRLQIHLDNVKWELYTTINEFRTHACELLGEAGNNPVTGCWCAIINLWTIRWYWSNRTPELLRLLIVSIKNRDGLKQRDLCVFFRFDSCKISQTHMNYDEWFDWLVGW